MMHQKAQITNFNYILLVFSIPFVLFILTLIFYFIFQKIAKVFFIITFVSLFVIVITWAVILPLFFGKTIKSNRASKERLNPLRKENYFFDLIEEAKRYKWSVKEYNRREVSIIGIMNSQKFNLSASLSRKGSINMHSKENITIKFKIKDSPTFYLTQGNLPGLLGEEIIKTPNFKLKGVTAIGKSNEHIKKFIIRNKKNIEYLFQEKGYLNNLVFEKGTAEAIILYDTNDEGKTEIYTIIRGLSKLIKDFNKN